jgi:hypothetical protein
MPAFMHILLALLFGRRKMNPRQTSHRTLSSCTKNLSSHCLLIARKLSSHSLLMYEKRSPHSPRALLELYAHIALTAHAQKPLIALTLIELLPSHSLLVRNNPITHKKLIHDEPLSAFSSCTKGLSSHPPPQGNKGDDDKEEKGQTRKRKRTFDKNQEVEAGMDRRPGDSEVTFLCML